MANEEALKILKQGVKKWNKWRETNQFENRFEARIDLTSIDLPNSNFAGYDFSYVKLMGANLGHSSLENANLFDTDFSSCDLQGAILADAFLCNAHLSGANLRNADLTGANLSGATLIETDLSAAKLCSANFNHADLREAVLENADLSQASFQQARLTTVNLKGANLSGANLFQANLTDAKLIDTNLTGANLSRSYLDRTSLENAVIQNVDLSFAILNQTIIQNARILNCKFYGASAWNLLGKSLEEGNIIITNDNEAIVTVDNIKVAQFIYLILNNEEIRDVINTLTSKTVLILGRFALPERKAILDALRNKLREYDLLPIVFDFDRPADKDFTETIKTLAGISYFVIADVTNPKSSPLELQATVPDYQIPFVPIIQEGESPFAMMVDLQKKYPWVLPTRSYDSIETLMSALKPGIIDPAVEMRNKLRLVKAQEQVTESLRDYVDKTL